MRKRRLPSKKGRDGKTLESLCCLVNARYVDGFCPKCPNFGKALCDDHSEDGICPVCRSLMYPRQYKGDLSLTCTPYQIVLDDSRCVDCFRTRCIKAYHERTKKQV